MKLHIKDNTLRLRLAKSEVEYFRNNGFIEEETGSENAVFTYCLQLANIDSISASFENNNLLIFMPATMVKEWTTTDLASCSGEIITGGNKKLFLFIEKDYQSRGEIFEEQGHKYKNPLAKNNEY